MPVVVANLIVAARRRFCSCVAVRRCGRWKENIVNLASWTLGLSLIVLTIAIHTTGVVMMAFKLETRIRIRVDTHKHDRLRAIPTVIGHIAAVALILAALHGLEGVL